MLDLPLAAIALARAPAPGRALLSPADALLGPAEALDLFEFLR